MHSPVEEAKKKQQYELMFVVYIYIKPKLVKAFFEWKIENKIDALRLGGSSGPRGYSGFFSSKDARKIKKWLLKK